MVPRLDDMHTMLQEIREEEAQDTVKEANHELNLENVRMLWNNYVEAIESDSTRSILKQAELQLEDKVVSVLVSSKLVENMVRQESDVVQLLRTEFALPELKFNIAIDPSKIQNKPKKQKPVTDKEKLRQMYESNPEVKTLTERFGLRFDD